MGERQAYCKHLTKDLNALLVSGEQKEHTEVVFADKMS